MDDVCEVDVDFATDAPVCLQSWWGTLSAAPFQTALSSWTPHRTAATSSEPHLEISRFPISPNTESTQN